MKQTFLFIRRYCLMTSIDQPPFIVTLQINKVAARYFNTLRKQYFPKALNFLDAHLTLFHQLPPGEGTLQAIANVASAIHHFSLQVTDIKSIGRGVAFVIRSEQLIGIHRSLQQMFDTSLTPQDRQRLWPHISIQNKVSSMEAGTTVEYLKSSFQPFFISATGFGVWEYLNGPWRHHSTYPFL